MGGIARVCESKLVLEFEARESLFRIGTREVACPFGEIESVAFKERGLLRYVLLFGTKRLHPSSRAGQFALYVAREHKSRVREAESLLLYGPQGPERHERFAVLAAQASPAAGRHRLRPAR